MKTNSQTQSGAASRCSAWLDGNIVAPPKDGTTIVAIGRVIVADADSTLLDTFTAAIYWLKDSSGYEGWHHTRDDMTVAHGLRDKILVDWWLPMPSNDRTERPEAKP